MEITLKDSEAGLLQDILREYVSELRMEICGTDSYAMREALKAREIAVKGIIHQMEQKSPTLLA